MAHGHRLIKIIELFFHNTFFLLTPFSRVGCLICHMCICDSVVQCQEKSFVTGLEAANRLVDYLDEGTFARIIPVEEDEPHIQALRSLNRNLNEIIAQLPWSNYFIQ